MHSKVTNVELIDDVNLKGVWYKVYKISTTWLKYYVNDYFLYLKFGHEPPMIDEYYSFEVKDGVIYNLKHLDGYVEPMISGSIVGEVTRRVNGGGQVA